MANDSTNKAISLSDTDLDTVHAGSSRLRTSSGFSDVSGLGREVDYSEYREGEASSKVLMAYPFNEPHD